MSEKKILSDCSCLGVFFFIISTGTNSAQPQVTLRFHDPSAVPWVNVYIISVARETRQAGALMFTVESESRLPLLLHDKVRLVVGTASHHGNATHATRCQKKLLLMMWRVSSWQIHKKRFHFLFISLANRSNRYPARSHQRAQTRRKGDDCALSGLSLGEAASKHSAPVISELWFHRK